MARESVTFKIDRPYFEGFPNIASQLIKRVFSETLVSHGLPHFFRQFEFVKVSSFVLKKKRNLSQ